MPKNSYFLGFWRVFEALQPSQTQKMAKNSHFLGRNRPLALRKFAESAPELIAYSTAIKPACHARHQLAQQQPELSDKYSNKDKDGWNTYGDTGELTQRFAHACPQVKALLGDAAHPMLQYLAQGAGQAIEDAVVLREALRHTRGDVDRAFQTYQQARYLRTGRVQLTARFYGDVYHALGVQRELRNQMFQNGLESAGFARLKWMYDGIEPSKLFK